MLLLLNDLAALRKKGCCPNKHGDYLETTTHILQDVFSNVEDDDANPIWQHLYGVITTTIRTLNVVT